MFIGKKKYFAFKKKKRFSLLYNFTRKINFCLHGLKKNPLSVFFFSGKGDTVLSILIDLNDFWTYENREYIVLDAAAAADEAEIWSIFLSFFFLIFFIALTIIFSFMVIYTIYFFIFQILFVKPLITLSNSSSHWEQISNGKMNFHYFHILFLFIFFLFFLHQLD